MRTSLILNINDFPAYRIVSGWSTHEKLTCSYYMENNKVFTLTNEGKTSFFYCHQCYLPTDHRYRMNKKDFFIGRVKKDVSSLHLFNEELYDVVLEYVDILFGF